VFIILVVYSIISKLSLKFEDLHSGHLFRFI